MYYFDDHVFFFIRSELHADINFLLTELDKLGMNMIYQIYDLPWIIWSARDNWDKTRRQN